MRAREASDGPCVDEWREVTSRAESYRKNASIFERLLDIVPSLFACAF